MIVLQGTWKKQLRTKFRNWRRGEKREFNETGEGIQESDAADCTPSKKRRHISPDEPLELELDCEHENNKDLIQEECSKSKPKLSTLKQLMDATYDRRRQWIKTTIPTVSAVFETYPCLKTSGKIVSCM